MTDAPTPPNELTHALERLTQTMRKLRAACPWDAAQDIASLRPYLLEEAYEVLEEMDQAARGASWKGLRDELGDLLFQVVFHSTLAEEARHFTLAEAIDACTAKLERRHPHVFAGQPVGSAQELARRWAEVKRAERLAKGATLVSALDGIPRALPALARASRLADKASAVGFDWEDACGPRRKLDEEVDELDRAVTSADMASIEAELGDVLFTVANLGRKLGIAAEDALRASNARFEKRFRRVEALAAARGITLDAAGAAMLNEFWEEAKRST